jgi:hypothetical protein
VPGEAEIIVRLDRIHAILAIAFAEQVTEFGERIRADKVNAAVLDAATDWIGSSELQKKVAAKASTSTRTVRDRLGQLATQRVLEVRGPEARPEYRVTGVI